MSIAQDELKKIAENLSKIPSESGALIENINNILGYVQLLDELDTENVIPTVSVIDKASILRVDTETRNITWQELLSCSPQKIVSNHITLPNIMK